MARSAAATVDAYLAGLPPERREVMATLRQLVRTHLPEGYVEAMNWGMIAYQVPLQRYADTYNGQPLLYAALAAQKNNYSLYLTCAYLDAEREAELRRAFAEAGKRPDMGKSCVRFKKLDDLPLPAIGRIVAATSVDEFVAAHEAGRR